MNPFHLFKLYFKALSENVGGGKISPQEKCYHFLIPAVFSLAFIFYVNNGISSQTINFLITVHGILISVLMASFTPFIEKLEYKGAVKSDVSEQEKDFAKSLRVAKKIVFTANSLAIYISMVIIVFLLSYGAATKFINQRQGTYNLHCVFVFILIFLIVFNAVLIVRTVHILSDIVVTRIDTEEQ